MPLDPEEELRAQSLGLEMEMMKTPGWQIRRERITAMFTRDMAAVGLGQIKDQRENDIAVGRCRVLKEILDMDQNTSEQLEALADARRDDPEDTGELEGGDHGVGYEAAQ